MLAKKKSLFFIISLTMLLAVGYVLISFNNRYQYDDFGFSALVREQGLWQAFTTMYFSWETTYLTLLLFFQLKFIHFIPPFVYNTGILAANSICFFLLLQSVLQSYAIKLESARTFLLAVLVILLSYFACRGSGNVTYWVTGQIVYCFFLCFFFLGLHFWIEGRLWFAAICMFLFGHTRINYDAIFIGLFAAYHFFVWIERKRIVLNWRQQVPFLFFLAGVITYVMVPGNYKRAETFTPSGAESDLSVLLLIKGWVSAFIHLGGTLLKNWKQWTIFPVGMLTGIYLFEYTSLRKRITLSFLWKCTVAFVIAYIGQATVLLLAIRTPVGYGRIFYFLELLLFILLLLYGIYLGFAIRKGTNEKLSMATAFLSGSLLTIVFAIHFYTNWRLSLQFARAYDERIQNLQALKEKSQKNDIYLMPLPPSGILDFDEIEPRQKTAQELPDQNAVYSRFYNLPFRIYLKEHAAAD